MNAVWGSKIQERHYVLDATALSEKLVKEKTSKSWFGNPLSAFSEKIQQQLGQDNIPVDLPIHTKKRNIEDKEKSYRAFKQMQEFPPEQPPQDPIFIKSDQSTFNHVSDYIIHNDAVWYRRKDQKEWILMYFDGYPDVKPVKVQADGSNLIVVDDKGYVHYKKVLKERLRVFEVEAQAYGAPSAKAPILAKSKTHDYTIKDDIIWLRKASKETKNVWQPFYFKGWPDNKPMDLSVEGDTLRIYDERGNVYFEDVSVEGIEKKLESQNFPYKYHYDYSAITKDTKDNWKIQWFSLPVIEKALCFLKEKKLRLSEKILAFALSNRGGYNACWEDFAGSEHPSCVGSELPHEKANFSPVTTFYAVFKGERFIRFADPWLPGRFSLHSFPGIPDKKIDFPSDFEFKNFSASASDLFLSGTNSKGEPCLYRRIADFDNDVKKKTPFLPTKELADIEHKQAKGKYIKPAIRVLPTDYKNLPVDQLWAPISLEGLDGKNVDFSSNTILQTGRGNNAKELRFASLDKNEKGYYSKSLQENVPWVWHSTAAAAG